MKVCPNCGFVDPDYWLPSRWRITEYCRIEDLEQNESGIAKSLMEKKPMEIVTDQFYAYRMNETGFVERIWVKLYEVGGKSAFNLSREARHFNPKFRHPKQKTLFEEEG